MKKIFLFSLLSLCSLLFVPCSNAQGNLQFNQVLTITPGTNYVVPTGKVVKIESINITSNSVCIPKSSTENTMCYPAYGNAYAYDYGIYNSIVYMAIGNLQFSTPSFSGQAGNYCQGPTANNSACWNYSFANTTFNTPIWLSEGKNIFLSSGVASILISAIEFNIIP
jgi:hypothetical protein